MNNFELATSKLGSIKDAHYEVAVLPMAATEAHGYHLPYATDTIQVEEMAQTSCEQATTQGAKILLLPTIPYGVNENTLGFPWTMSLRPSTILEIFKDLTSCLEQHGIPKLLILNGHGGNEFQPHLRELCRLTPTQIMLVNWFNAVKTEHDEVFELPGEHADEMETSLLLHLRPELVDMSLASDGATREPVFTAMKEGWAWLARPWDRFTYDSSFGDPRRATADKGEKYFNLVVSKISNLLVEMSSAPIDEMYPYQAD